MSRRRGYAIGPWFPDTIGLLAALLRRNGDEEESQSLAQTLGSGAAIGDATFRFGPRIVPESRATLT
ncbi:MAG TPA: hypothetical protein VJW96_00555 [Terriglobales bacterium]|jgi:hypothetical protein|nr:hypothetical protein [Terriglobales bacterium]